MKLYKKLSLVIVLGLLAVSSYWFMQANSFNKQAFETEFKKANQLLAGGHNDQAITIYTTLLALNNSYAAVYFNCARAYANKNDWACAALFFEQALAHQPVCADIVHFYAGQAHFQLKQFDCAQQHFEQAIALNAHDAFAYYYLSCLAQERGNVEQAAQYGIQACELNAEFSTVLIQMATKLRDQQQFQLAATCYKTALKKDPNNAFGHQALADVLNILGDPDGALDAYAKAYALNPKCHNALHNSGVIYAGQKGNLSRALEFYQKALQIEPDHAGTHASLSALYLMQGDLQRGWAEYEWRLRKFFDHPQYNYQKPRWDGTASLNGKRILLVAEQGLGDTLQFIRYAMLLKQQGAYVIAQVQKPLVRLLSLCPFLDSVVIQTSSTTYDYYIELMSLPFKFKTTLQTIPAQIPYIFPDSSLATLWQNKVADDKNFKIGLCWHVDPSHDADVYRAPGKKISVTFCKRSIPLHSLVNAISVPGVSLYSLQKYHGTQELDNQYKGVIKEFGSDFDTSHGSFMDTAAIMKHLDLIITADTSIAHLAGALGVPVWVLLPYPADWRWLLDRTYTPWYPTMRLFRKKGPKEDWSTVMQEIKVALDKYMTNATIKLLT